MLRSTSLGYLVTYSWSTWGGGWTLQLSKMRISVNKTRDVGERPGVVEYSPSMWVVLGSHSSTRKVGEGGGLFTVFF